MLWHSQLVLELSTLIPLSAAPIVFWHHEVFLIGTKKKSCVPTQEIDEIVLL